MSRKSKLLVKRLATVLCYVEFYPCHVQNGLSKLRSSRITIRGKNKSGPSLVRHVVKVIFFFVYRFLFFHRISTAIGFFYRDFYDRSRTLCIFRFQELVDATTESYRRIRRPKAVPLARLAGVVFAFAGNDRSRGSISTVIAKSLMTFLRESLSIKSRVRSRLVLSNNLVS